MQHKRKITLKDLVIATTQSTLIITLAYIIIIGLLYIKVITHENYKSANDLIEENGNHFVSKLLVLNNLEKIPDNHLDIVEKHGYKIVIDKEIINEYNEENNKNCAGFVRYKDKIICLYPSEYAGVHALHEIGHILNYHGDSPCKTDEFKELFEIEKHKARDYSQTNTNEYFADIYMIHFNDKLFLFKNEEFPKTIEYMHSLDWW